MVGVKSSKDPRSSIQNGFWFFKYLLMAGLVFGFFYIRSENLSIPLMWVGMIGGFLFILIQLILIVDFAHGLAEGWLDKYVYFPILPCVSHQISAPFNFLVSYSSPFPRSRDFS